MICCVRDCESTETQQHRIQADAHSGFAKRLTYVVRICESCRKSLINKPVRTTHWQCGRLAFVNELWEGDPDGTN